MTRIDADLAASCLNIDPKKPIGCLPFDVIATLASLAARRATETAGALEPLEDPFGTMLDHHSAGRTKDYFDLNTIFHDLILQSCADPNLRTIGQRFMIRARQSQFSKIVKPEQLEQAVAEHEDLMQAFREGNAPKAFAIWEPICATQGNPSQMVLTFQAVS